MSVVFLYIVVFLSGGAVLALEILGTRILGPFYGVSLFLWSALITVTLVALSVGYAIGGRWSDKNPQMTRLLYIVAGAGLWTLLIPWLKRPMLMVAEPFGLRTAVLLAAFILFAPPLTLLGMVSPYAIKVRAASMQVVGRTAGNLYAISTMGSVVLALLTGFVLIPNIGVNFLTVMIGVCLIALVVSGLLLTATKRMDGLLSVALVAVGVAALWLTPHREPNPERGLLAIEQSPYAELRVVDFNGLRHLVIDGGVHTIIEPSTWTSHFPYTHVVDIARDFYNESGDLLLIGLGGGTVAKKFSKEGWEVTAVEIDPKVVAIAREYFGLKSTEADIHAMDGRKFLITHPDPFDLIVMDAFGSSSIPFHLVTKESFGLIATRLRDDGVLAVNLESRGWHHILIRSLAATLQTHFKHVLALPTTQSQDKLGNIILIASNREWHLSGEASWRYTNSGYELGPNYYRRLAWDNRFVPNTLNVPVLTDDLNPVDLWSESINLEARKALHRYFEESGVSW